MATVELRLIDPCGYDAVTTGHRVTVTPDQVPAAEAELRTTVAARHAAEHPYAGYRVADYRVRATDLTQVQPPLLPTGPRAQDSAAA